MADFLVQARLAFEFLEREHGYQVADYQPSESFGDALLELRSTAVCIRVIRERGQVFIDLAPAHAPADWFDLPVLLRLLGEVDEERRLISSGQRSLEYVAEVLRVNYPKLEALFRRPDYSATAQHLRELRQTSVSERFGPNNS